MKRLILFAPLAVFVLLGAYFAVGLKRDPSRIPSVLIDKPLPAIDLPAIDGLENGFSSDDIKGEVAFIPPAEGDNPGALAPALNEFPSLAGNRTKSRTLPTSATITARAGTGFTKADETQAKRKSSALAANVAPIRKRSFFRTRATVTPQR